MRVGIVSVPGVNVKENSDPDSSILYYKPFTWYVVTVKYI